MPVLLVLGFFVMMIFFLHAGWEVAFWIFFGLLCIVAVGLIWMLISIFLAGGTPSKSPPPPPKEKRTQTEDEFNEMAMTNLYANYYLDQDGKDKNS